MGKESKSKHELKETLDAKVTEENGSRQLNQYSITKQLGQGSFGSVHLAFDNQAERYVAIKECSKSKLRKQKAMASGPGRGRGRGRRSTLRRVTISRPKVVVENPLDLVRTEIAILKKLDHPNVVKLYEVLDDPTQDSLFMVFELCEKGCVLDLNMDGQVTPLPTDLARSYFQQLMLGIEYRIAD
jgi:serine/threonine protein kinase